MTDRTALQSLRATVTGRVQGVGFRFYTLRVAQKLELVGWVKNESDGSVSIEAVGTGASLDTFVSRIRQGPASARVDGVQVQWGKWGTENVYDHSYLTFEVR